MKRLLLIMLCIVIMLVSVAWFGGRWILSFSVAEYEGEIHVPHVQHPVEITFDAQGIPQIWAETNSDVFFAIGWLHASERLFQMELIRRMAAGELSEIFGDFAYEADLFQRKIGFKRIAEKSLDTIDTETLYLLEQYCRGINAWITHKTILPPEFEILRITPNPWNVVDCLTIMVYQTWYTHEESDEDANYHQLIEKFGDALAQYLLEPFNWSPSILQRRESPSSLFKYNRFPFRMTNASNSWVVSPRKSTTNAALHASDPHLEICSIPGFWYIIGLHSQEDFHFLGITTPGLPFGAMGHNGTIAYAFTTAGVDITDYYHYQRHPDDPLQILTENGYQRATVIQEEIRVQGEEQPRKVSVSMIDKRVIVEETPTTVVALQWAGFDFDAGKIMNSAIAIMNAQNFSEFREAATHLGALDVNWTYSDIQGNIGYQLGTPIPKRRFSNTFRRLSGSDPSTAWQEYYPLSETPYVYNPQEGWIAVCNNWIASEDWPYKVPVVYDPYRIVRAEMLLSQKEMYSPEDMGNIQMDIISGAALQWKHVLASGAELLGRHDLVQEILQWDGGMSLESQQALLFTYWWEFLPKFLFEDDLGTEWRDGISIVDVVLAHQIDNVIDDRRTTRLETLADIAASTLEYVLPMVQKKSMDDISVLEMEHPLSEVKILDFWLHLNRGPFHLPGDGSTLNVNWKDYDEKTGKFYTVVGPTMRYVLDWADIDAFTIHTNLGQSGNPLSPHYDDFLDIWLKGEQWIVPFSREKVYAGKASLLYLMPQSSK